MPTLVIFYLVIVRSVVVVAIVITFTNCKRTNTPPSCRVIGNFRDAGSFLREFLKFFSGFLGVFCEIDNLDLGSSKSTLSVTLKATKNYITGGR